VEHHLRELHVARILLGRLRVQACGRPFVVRAPTREERYLAQEAYCEALREAELEGLYSEPELLDFLRRHGLWTDTDQRDLDAVTHDLDELKIALYQSGFRSHERQRVRGALAEARRRQMALLARRHAYDDRTAHAHAAARRERHLVGPCLLLPDGTPAFAHPGQFWDEPGRLLDEVIQARLLARIPATTFRELARTEPWRGVWSCRESEGGVFGVPAADLTEEQRELASWSRLYDSVLAHPSHPSSAVIEDDDALDGWLLLQDRDRKRAEDRADASTVVGGKIGNCQEVFVMADTPEDARRIDSLNTESARRVRESRLRHLAARGELDEADMPDTRMRLLLAANNAR
jgi:hypothetical protein